MSALQDQIDALKARRARMAAAAVPDHGIDLKRPKGRVISVERKPLPEISPPAVVRQFQPWRRQLAEDNEQLRSLFLQPETIYQRKITAEHIQRVVAREFGFTRDDLISARRQVPLVIPRHVAMYLVKVLTPKSLPEIGRRFGGRDHTTVLHAIRRMEEKIAVDTEFAKRVEELKGRLST